MKDNLGTRMKRNYEFVTRSTLPRRTYTIIRLDGKSFHTYTRGLERPFDRDFARDMATAARFLCEQAQGSVFAYTQSDEISILLTDFATIRTDPWFGGNVQKIASVAASIVTAKFNELRFDGEHLALFDARVFSIPDPTEVENYFVWRQKDCIRNSIQSLAQSQFSHAELQGININKQQGKLFNERGINWSQTPAEFKNGHLIWLPPVSGSGWVRIAAPIFTQNTDWRKLIPRYDDCE